jgi:hypothetical protein
MSDNIDLLDATLDDLADLPTFAAFPVGAHRATMKLEIKEINKKTAVEIKLVGHETVELSNPSDAPIKDGDETNVLYILKNNDGSPNEIAQGKLKIALAVIKEKFGFDASMSNRAVIEAVKDGFEVVAVTKQRENKSSGGMNTDLVKFEIV